MSALRKVEFTHRFAVETVELPDGSVLAGYGAGVGGGSDEFRWDRNVNGVPDSSFETEELPDESERAGGKSGVGPG